jgi:hypothetical protein
MNRRRQFGVASLVLGFLVAAASARAQTMAEYPGVASGTGVATGSSGFNLEPPSGQTGSSSWSTSPYGAASGGFGGSAISQFPSFAARASERAGGGGFGESRWPGTAFRNHASASESRLGKGAGNRFPNTRFNDNGIATDFGSRLAQSSAGGAERESRWPGSAFRDHQGLDMHFNSLNGY